MRDTSIQNFWLAATLGAVVMATAACQQRDEPPVEHAQAEPSTTSPAESDPVPTGDDVDADTGTATEEGDGVSGTLRGQPVAMQGAELDNTLAIYEGDGWAFNPSLLIFPFDHDLRPGQTITVTPESRGGIAPHIHYRWNDPESDRLDVEIATSDYEMTLRIDAIEGDDLVGHLEFEVPGEETKVSGPFRARMDADRKAELTRSVEQP